MNILKRIKNKIYNSENNKIIFNNVLGAFFIKGGSLMISLFTLPAYMNYFEEQQILGLWFTILSVLTWVLTFDLGIGNGLRNHLVPAIVNKDQLLAKRYISSAYIMLGFLTMIIISISTITFRFINWNNIFNISTEIVSKQALATTIIIVFTGIMLQFLLRLITSILHAMQKSALNNLLSLVTSVIILLFVLTANTSSDISSNLITLALVHVLAVNIPLIITTLVVFTTKLKDSKPSFKYYGNVFALNVIKLGGLFLWVQIMYMIITTTNEFIITWFSGPEYVVEYQVYHRLFNLIGTLFALALIPIWSAVTKALSEGNYTWIKKLYKTLQFLALLAIVSEFIFIFFLQYVINFWLGDNAIDVNLFYAFIFAMSGSVFILNAVLSSMSNGFGQLKTQAVFFTIGAVIKIPIAWLLVNHMDSWIGVVIANIIAMSLYSIIQPFWINNYINKKERGL